MGVLQDLCFGKEVEGIPVMYRSNELLSMLSSSRMHVRIAIPQLYLLQRVQLSRLRRHLNWKGRFIWEWGDDA